MVGQRIRQRTWTDWGVIAIAVITILSGAIQVFASQAVLSTLEINITPEVNLLFVMVSLFSALFGAALLHSMLIPGSNTVVVLWSGLQKLSGSSVVLIGVLQNVMAPTALLAAGYDFLAGLFVLWYWLRIRSALV